MAFLNKKILAIIPCRSGSKKIINKNLIKINNKPLLYYSILFAKQCKFFDKIIVSTDSIYYKKLAKKFGAEVPFLRPKKISGDKSTDVEFVNHCVDYLKKKNDYNPDFIVHLRPTSPLRKIKDVKKSLKVLIKNKKIDSVKTIYLTKDPVFKMWFLNNLNVISPVTIKKTKFSEPFNSPRQFLPKSYIQTALFDIYRVGSITKKNLSGKKIYGLLTDKFIDIDTIQDFRDLKKYINKFRNFIKFIKK